MAVCRAGWHKDRAAHGAGEENNAVMGTNLSAEGPGEERKGLQADWSCNLMPGQLLPPAGKHQFFISTAGTGALLLLSAVLSLCAGVARAPCLLPGSNLEGGGAGRAEKHLPCT